MHQVGIRFATAADLPVLSAFLADCITDLPDCEERALATRTAPESLLSTHAIITLLITFEGEPCGFAVVQCCAETEHQMLGLYVSRIWRRNGIGTRAARCLFEYFPGTWELRTNALNVPATAFWRAVADRVTLGRYHEIWRASKTWRGFIHRFVMTHTQARSVPATLPVRRHAFHSLRR